MIGRIVHHNHRVASPVLVLLIKPLDQAAEEDGHDGGVGVALDEAEVHIS